MVLEEMFLDSRPFFRGFIKTVVAFSGLGWLAMDRNNFMIAFLSEEIETQTILFYPKLKGRFQGSTEPVLGVQTVGTVQRGASRKNSEGVG